MSAAFLEEVVTMAGLALQAEDCLVRAAVHHRGEHGGLVQLRNERYYQFIIWRAVLSKWHAVVERNSRDLIIKVDDREHHFEMKNWRRDSPTILQDDITRLSAIPEGGYMLVVSDNPKNAHKYTEEALELASKLTSMARHTRAFDFLQKMRMTIHPSSGSLRKILQPNTASKLNFIRFCLLDFY